MQRQLLGQCIGAAHAANQRRDFAAALAWCRQALELHADLPEAWYNAGLAHAGLGRRPEALAAFERARRLTGASADAQNSIGLQLLELGALDAAEECLRRALRLAPEYAFAHSNLGRLREQRRQFAEAEASFRRAIALRPDLAPLYANLGGLLNARGQAAAAEEACRAALARDPDLPGAWANLGTALSRLERHAEAAECRARCLALDDDAEFVLGEMLLDRMRGCQWHDLDAARAQLRAKIEGGAKATTPFPALTLFDDPALQRRAAEIYVAAACPAAPGLGPLGVAPRRDRLRIGYFSPDLREHAVSYLMAEVFERHDKARFEIFGFSYGPDDASPMRARVAAACDTFLDVRDLSDRQVAELSRARGIDIAIDLAGYTTGARPGILAWRAAPMQASYLGYLGTSGAPYIDYLFADATLIPEAQRRHYSENIVYLPSYQANDTRRPIAERVFGRAELGLPEHGVVFCCCNNNYKLTPEVYDVWMRILGEVDGAVLLLHADNALAADNLRREAERRGVDGGRIVPHGRLPRPEYMARYRVADLFLDSHPYNAGTTASDALWAGLPVLTRAGDAFASRIAASLLNALDMPEFVAASWQDYAARGVALAREPARLAEARAKLARQGAAAPLFDAARFTHRLEAAYAAMLARHQSGQPPEDLVID